MSWSITAMIESISAITLATHDMARAVSFYRVLGFEIINGGDDAAFTSFRAGRSYLNLIAQPAERKWSWWGRVIFYHSDVDALHARVVAAGYRTDTVPRDAEWGERFFHLTDHTRAQFRLASAMRASARSTCRPSGADTLAPTADAVLST
jgi:catechol 2,3-dioxygenase-like lactoylglutathione lyase family enzyme